MLIRELVYDEVKKQILRGDLRSGHILSENKLAKEFRTNRMTIRQSIRLLENEDFVKSIDKIGTVVQEISYEKIKQIWEMRITLESKNLETLINIITIDQLNELGNNVRMSEIYLAKDEFEKVFDLMDQFHEILFKITNKEYLWSIIHKELIFDRRMQFKNNDRSERKKLLNDHFRLIKFLKDRNLDEAQKLISTHRPVI